MFNSTGNHANTLKYALRYNLLAKVNSGMHVCDCKTVHTLFSPPKTIPNFKSPKQLNTLKTSAEYLRVA